MRIDQGCAAIGALMFALLGGPMAAAQSNDLIHADTPLWAPGMDGVWPQLFQERGAFGCIHSIRMGDWRYSPSKPSPEPEGWYRLTNYGAVHCFIGLEVGNDRGHFDSVRTALLVDLGRAGGAQLWALQIGTLPGSDYLLLSRPSTPPIDNDHYAVLQRECPENRVRSGEPFELHSTAYCSINTREALVALAERMAALPPLGTLTFERRLPGEARPRDRRYRSRRTLPPKAPGSAGAR